jgi:hypothetical protein
MAGFRGMIDVVGTNTMARVDLMKRRIAFAALALSLATPALADIRSTSTEVRILSSSGGVAASYADFLGRCGSPARELLLTVHANLLAHLCSTSFRAIGFASREGLFWDSMRQPSWTGTVA